MYSMQLETSMHTEANHTSNTHVECVSLVVILNRLLFCKQLYILDQVASFEADSQPSDLYEYNTTNSTLAHLQLTIPPKCMAASSKLSRCKSG